MFTETGSGCCGGGARELRRIAARRNEPSGRALRGRSGIAFAALLMFLGSGMRTAVGDEQTYRLLLADKDKESVLFYVSPGQPVRFSIEQPPAGKPEGAGPLRLHLGPFRSEHGDLPEVRLVRDDGTSVAEGVKADGPFLPLRLEVPPIPTTATYRGLLTLIGVVKVSWTIGLKRSTSPRTAVVAVDRHEITLAATRSFFGNSDVAFAVRLWEKGRDWPLEGVYARLEGVRGASAGTFDPKDIAFEFGGRKTDIWVMSDERRVDPGGSVEVLATLPSGLPPGEYGVDMRFLARNAAEDDLGKLKFTVRIRGSWWWAIAVLLVSIVASLVTTRALATRTKHREFRRRLGPLSPHWLEGAPALLPIVRYRALTRQIEDRSSRWWLSGSDVIETRLAEAERTLPLLEHWMRLSDGIESLQENPLIIRRGKKRLRAIMSHLGPGVVDEKRAKDVGAQLEEMNKWLEPPLLAEQYRASLDYDVASLLAAVDENQFDGPVHRKKVRRLVSVLKASPSLTGKDPMETKKVLIERDRNYSRLKILHERRNAAADHLNDLMDAIKDVDDLFRVADNYMWMRLLEERQQIRFRSPTKGEDLRAYQPIRFEIEPESEALRDNYLFQHKLRYVWGFDLDKGPRPKLMPETNEPRVVQYVPRDCKLSPSVTIVYEGEGLDPAAQKKIEVPYRTFESGGESHAENEKARQDARVRQNAEPLTVGRSRDFNAFRAFDLIGVLATAVAAAVAVATGLGALYFTNPTFGSAQDYVALFLWGLTGDQVKNLFQKFGASTG